MNKYQEALDSVKDLRIDFIDLGYISYVTDSDIENLKELVGKATAKTPNNVKDDDFLNELIADCSNCNKQVREAEKYCPYCGQKLNWNKRVKE